MRAILASALTLALSAAPALAQNTATATATAGAAATAAAAPMNLFAASADVQALIANARKQHKTETNFSQHILTLAPYNANLEYRTGLAPASVHEKDAELFYVIEGSGTMVTGGTVVNPTRTNEANLSGPAIAGGQTRKIAKGDFLIVPQGQPHQITQVDGELMLMTFHVPRS